MKVWVVLTANYLAALGIVFNNKWLYKAGYCEFLNLDKFKFHYRRRFVFLLLQSLLNQ